jgi:hypothetical protein
MIQMILKTGQEQMDKEMIHHQTMDSRIISLCRVRLDLVQWMLGIDQEICADQDLYQILDLVLDSIRLMDIHKDQINRHKQEEVQEKIS